MKFVPKSALGRLVLALVVVLAFFAAFPGVDLGAARLVHGADGFIGASAGAKAWREVFRVTPYALLIVMLLLWAARWRGYRVFWAPSGRAALYLALTMAIGPGLIVNVGLKEHSHRPRPVHLSEFGGTDDFRPWDRFDGACAKNCSFASGEAAQGFWMVAPALLVPAPLQGAAVVAAVGFGLGASGLRLAFGGHFLSDVLVGALIALIVVLALKPLLRPAKPAEPGLRDPAQNL